MVLFSTQPPAAPLSKKPSLVTKLCTLSLSVSIALSALFVASVSTANSAQASSCSCNQSTLYTIDIETLNDNHPQQLMLKANNAYYQLVDDKGSVLQDKLYDIHAYEDGRIIAKRNGYFGAINASGKVVLDFKYDAIEALDQGFYQLTEHFGSKTATAIANDAGRWLYPASGAFDKNTQADYLYTDKVNQITYFAIEKNGKHGLITDKAQTLIAPIYDELSLLDTCPNERLFMKAVMGDKTGLIDQYQKIVVPFTKNTDIINFNEDKQIFSVMSYNTKPDDNDYNDDALISEKLVSGKGISIIQSESSIIHLEGNLYKYKKSGKYGIINDKGDVVLPANFDDLSSTYSSSILVMQNQKTGVLSKHEDGSLNVDTFYDNLERYDATTYTLSEIENQAVAEEAYDYDSADYEEVADAIEETEEETDDTTEAIQYNPEIRSYIAQRNRKVGIVDSNNNVLVPLIYDELVDFEHFIKVKKDQKYGLITENNDIIKPLIYDDITSADDSDYENIRLVFTKDQQQQLTNKFAHPLTELSDYRFISDKLDNLEEMNVIEKDGKYGLFSYKEKKVTVPPIYEDMSGHVYNDTILAQLAGKTVLIDTSGKLLIKDLSQYAYTDRSEGNDKIVITTKDDKYGLIDYAGKTIIEPIYDSIEKEVVYNNLVDLYEGGDRQGVTYYFTEKSDKFGLLDSNGKTIIPSMYTALKILPYPGLLLVSKSHDIKNGKFGMADMTGKLLTELEYDTFQMTPYMPGIKERIYMIKISKNTVDEYDYDMNLIGSMSFEAFKENDGDLIR